MDFFISYTSADRAWAEWIAWQLEAAGYQVVVQAWDFGAGHDWAHEMQRSTSTALRLVAVLSPDSLRAEHVEAEWRPFYANDPSGERGLLLPVRVREVDPTGLLRTRVYVDLVGRDAVSARAALLAAARGSRGRPAHEPEFPGDRGVTAVNGGEAPRFPGDLPPTDSNGGVLLEESTEALRADDVGAIRAVAERMTNSLWRSGFAESDVEAFKISLRELFDNVATHVRGDETVELRLSRVERSHNLPTYLDRSGHDNAGVLEGLNLEVSDRGRGFDFDNALMRSETELSEHGIEHGLLRAYRLGSLLYQISIEPHVMGWMKERTPQAVPTVFGGEHVIPFVFSYRQESIRIWQTVHTFYQFGQYLRRSEAFMNLIFDPLQRPARKYVGIEITGQSWSGSLYWREVLDRLLSFTKRNARFDKQLLLFADVGPSEQRGLREYCENAGILMFEDESEIRNLDEATIQALEQSATQNREVTDTPQTSLKVQKKWFRRK